jgi:hypothetical protein
MWGDFEVLKDPFLAHYSAWLDPLKLETLRNLLNCTIIEFLKQVDQSRRPH